MLRLRPFGPTGGRRRIGRRIAGGKGLSKSLVELLLRLGPRLARRRLSRLFHPGVSVALLRALEAPNYIGREHRGSEVLPRKRSTAEASVRFCARVKLFNCLTSLFCNLKIIQRSLPEDLLSATLFETNIEQLARKC